MKNLFTLLFWVITTCSQAQWATMGHDSITFDRGDVYYSSLIYIDTVNYHHNIWQIGTPTKTIFNSVYSMPRAIVTDTLNPYLANDTSVFIVKIPGRRFPTPFPVNDVGFYYKLHIDSGATIKIEI